MQIIPIADTYSQVLNAQLAGQNCKLAVYQRSTGLFLDLFVNDLPIIVGVLCQNLNLAVRSGYLGFKGDLMFCDMQGSDDPTSPGLGSRWVLFYLAAADIA